MLAVSESEQATVLEARTGKPEAWDALFRRYQLPLYVYVFELVQNEQASLDIVQESFINAARYLERLQDDAKFGSWLFSIAHQKCLQHWRKPKVEEPFDAAEFEQLAEDDPDPSEWLLRKEQEEDLMRLLNQLPLPHRSVLLLHFIEEFSLEEIAAITGTLLGTVKSRLHYAKKALRKLIEDTP